MDTKLRELLDEDEDCRQELIDVMQDSVEFENDEAAYLEKIGLSATEKNRYNVDEMISDDLVYLTTRIKEIQLEVTQIKKLSRVIAELCVVKNLPAGDPCWIAQFIGTYIEIS